MVMLTARIWWDLRISFTSQQGQEADSSGDAGIFMLGYRAAE